jgi:hypothetical protein
MCYRGETPSAPSVTTGSCLEYTFSGGYAKNPIDDIGLSMRGGLDALPGAFSTTALLDTGSSMTAVAPFVIEYLGIVPCGITEVLVPGDAGAMSKRIYGLYDVRIGLQAYPEHFRGLRVVAAMPATPGVSVLLGRDILDSCRFVFDGPKQRFTLWY